MAATQSSVMVWNAVAQSRPAAAGNLRRLDFPVGLAAIVNSYPAPGRTAKHMLPSICPGVPAASITCLFTAPVAKVSGFGSICQVASAILPFPDGLEQVVPAVSICRIPDL